ncbi:hypothetical protein ACWCPS_00290 [Streptomyces mauvecolor]
MNQYDAQVEEIAEALNGMVGRGIKPHTLADTKYECLRRLNQVLAKAPPGSTSKKVCEAVHRAILDALTELRGEYLISTGRVHRQPVAAQNVRRAIQVLFSSTGRAEKRRKEALKLSGLGCSYETFRKEGPERDLMRTLARTLMPEDAPSAVLERVEVKYVFVDDADHPYGVRLDRAEVDCRIRAMRDCDSFEDRGTYLIWWPSSLRPSDAPVVEWYDPPLENGPLGYVDSNTYAYYQAESGRIVEPLFGLTAGFRFQLAKPAKRGETGSYGYTVRYPASKYVAFKDAFYRLTAKPRIDLVSAMVAVQLEGEAKKRPFGAGRIENYYSTSTLREIKRAGKSELLSDGYYCQEFSHPSLFCSFGLIFRGKKI